MIEARQIIRDFSIFVTLTIGTNNKEDKRYKEFKENVRQFKAYIVKQVLLRS